MPSLLRRPFAAHLPRDTRDTLLILAAVALVLLPQVPHLPLWCSALCAALLGWRTWRVWHQRPLTGKAVTAVLLIGSVAATVLHFRSIVGPDAGATLIALLLVLKTLEMRARRDAMVVFFLGFFTLLTLFLHSQSLLTAIAMMLALWALLTTLVNAHLPAGYPRLGQLLRTSGSLLLWALPLMLVLFALFPRLPPLWGMPTTKPQGTTGLSNDMTVGQVAELAQDASVALRVRFTDGPPPRHLLYFRGPVLSDFNGQTWRAPDAPLPSRALAAHSRFPIQQPSATPGLGYEVTLEPHRQRWLLTLETTTTAPTLARHAPAPLPTPDGLGLSHQPINDGTRYQASAQLQAALDAALSPADRITLLHLPDGAAPRTRRWGEQLRAAHGSDAVAMTQAALQQLRQGGYTYTLQPGIPTGDVSDAFWFDERQGFCEHIASAFAVLMRSAGVPARIVTGYQGGEHNPIDGLWTVRQSDAHAWTEIWREGHGWWRIDPTSAVAPSRTAQLQRAPASSTLLGDAVATMVSPDMLQRMRANWDAMNHRWNDLILNYNTRQQSHMLQALGLDQWSPAKITAWLAGCIGLALAITAYVQWRRRHQPDPWLRLLEQAQRRLLRHGLVPPAPTAATASPRQWAHAVQQQWGHKALPLHQWLLQMEQWRYAPHGHGTPSLPALRRQWRALAWPPTHTP